MEIDEKKYVETLDEEEEESELNTSVDEEDDIEDEEEEEIKDGNEEDQEVEAAVASILTGKRSGCIADNNKNDNREMVGDKSINNIIKFFYFFRRSISVQAMTFSHLLNLFDLNTITV